MRSVFAGVPRRSVVAGLGAMLAAASARQAGAESFFDFSSTSGTNPTTTAPSRPTPVRTVELDAPDFDLLHEKSPFLAGVRPYREGGMRLELRRPVETPTGTKHIIHNYGHGGAGVSLAFGAAETVRELALQAIETGRHGDAPTSFAVLGAGVVGLTAALALSERWRSLPVTIYARHIDADRTTSWLAGGQFAHPATLPEYRTPAQRSLLARHLERTEDRLYQLGSNKQHERYGITRRTSYSLVPGGGHDVRVRLGTSTHGARSYETWLIDPTRLLPTLRQDLEARDVRFEERCFDSLEDIHALPEPIVVNCTGLGARDLFDDPYLEGRRGHLVRLRNEAKLDYFLNSWCGLAAPRYLFARHDDIIIGGTSQRGREDGDFDPENPADVRSCQRILRNARGLYEKGGRTCG